MQISNKKAQMIVSCYGVVVVLANICGVMIPNLFWVSTGNGSDIAGWNAFKDEVGMFYTIFEYLSFIVPTVWCMTYVRRKDFEKRFISLPIAFSTIGISGWIVYLIKQAVFVIIARLQGYDFDIEAVIVPTVLNVLLEGIVTFTLAFFISESIHRRFVLPKVFPEGHLNKIDGLKQPSVKLLFVAKYVSVTLLPVVFMFFIFMNIVTTTGTSVDRTVVVTFIWILIIGIIISVVFTSYFDKPLKSLKKHVEKIKEGDYESHVKIVTNDSFGELADTLNDMVDSIREQNRKIQENLNLTITRMAIMVESRDNSTGGHIKRTSDCVRVFVEGLKKNPKYANISDDFFNAVIKAAPMHDLGKIAVKDSILTKNGRFTEDEYEQMKMHSAEGARIVSAILDSEDDTDFKQIAVNVAHYHHEKWNGAGYPEKISGENIPLEARIMALADVFDALVSKRCYKESMSYEESFKIIEESLGSHFDPELGAEFLKCRSKLEELYNSYA